MTAPTGPYQTDKLKLDVDPFDTTAIFPQDPNWQKVDAAAGVITITSGNEPADSVKYNGMIVYESDTGIMYWYDNTYAGGGYWQKRYIDYPWIYCGQNNSSQGGDTTIGWPNFMPTQSLNSSKANDSGANNSVKVPLKGIYQGFVYCRWQNSTSDIRSIVINLNGTPIYDTENTVWSKGSPYPISVHTHLNRMFLNKGDLILVNVSNPGSSVVFYSQIILSLLRPLP